MPENLGFSAGKWFIFPRKSFWLKKQPTNFNWIYTQKHIFFSRKLHNQIVINCGYFSQFWLTIQGVWDWILPDYKNKYKTEWLYKHENEKWEKNIFDFAQNLILFYRVPGEFLRSWTLQISSKHICRYSTIKCLKLETPSHSPLYILEKFEIHNVHHALENLQNKVD